MSCFNNLLRIYDFRYGRCYDIYWVMSPTFLSQNFSSLSVFGLKTSTFCINSTSMLQRYSTCTRTYMKRLFNAYLTVSCFKICRETWFEPPHDKTNKMACVPSEDSDQPGHPPSLIRVFAVCMKKACVLSYPWSASFITWWTLKNQTLTCTLTLNIKIVFQFYAFLWSYSIYLAKDTAKKTY